jgi:regulator of ribonuclease activity A
MVIWGAVRDVESLKNLDIGIKASGSNPWKSGKAGTGTVDVAVDIAGLRLKPGECYSLESGGGDR